MAEIRPRVYFVDIDGSLVVYDPAVFSGRAPMQMLPGSLEKLKEWHAKGHIIILTTGRPATRSQTVRQLEEAGVPYHMLITDLGGGVRVLINDRKPDGELTALSYSPGRNVGIAGIDE